MNSDDKEKVQRARIETDEMRLSFIQTELQTAATLLKLAETELTWEGAKDASAVLTKVDTACKEAGIQIQQARLRNQDASALEEDLQKLESGAQEMRGRVERVKITSD